MTAIDYENIFTLALLHMSGFLYAQIKPTNCDLSKLANYKNGATDTIVIRARYYAIDIPGSDPLPELNELNKKGILRKKDYQTAIVLWINGCKNLYVPFFTTGWKYNEKFNANKYLGKEYNFTCVFYKGVSDRKNRKYQFFTVLKME